MADPSLVAAKPGDFFCPRGGTWYACETGTKFVGCCTSDPCQHGCFGESIRPAGRSTALNNVSPGGSCGGSTPFWTCSMAPTFWGCCNEDACMNNSTCPPGKLEPAFWDRPAQYYYFHDLNVALSSTVPAPTAFSTSSSTATTASDTPTATAVTSSSKVSDDVIGGAVGGSLAFLIIIGAVVFFLYRRRRNKKNKSTEAEAADDLLIPKAELASPTTMTGFFPSIGRSPPPTYCWDTSGQDPQQKWAQYHNRPGEVMGDTRMSEVNSKYDDRNGPVELSGVLLVGELESREYVPKVVQGKSAHDTSKQQVHCLKGTGGEKTAAMNAQL